MVIAQKQRVLELIEFKHEQPEICQIIRELLNSDDSMSVL
jgi:hypothetical protein